MHGQQNIKFNTWENLKKKRRSKHKI